MLILLLIWLLNSQAYKLYYLVFKFTKIHWKCCLFKWKKKIPNKTGLYNKETLWTTFSASLQTQTYFFIKYFLFMWNKLFKHSHTPYWNITEIKIIQKTRNKGLFFHEILNIDLSKYFNYIKCPFLSIFHKTSLLPMILL